MAAGSRDAVLERLRALLSGREVREVSMFGGIALMVEDRMALSVGKDGDLLVHVDPADYPALLDRDGAEPATMGRRPMGDRWLRVDAEHVGDDASLRFWLDRGLAGASA